MYPEHLVAPMREELSAVGFEELKTPDLVTNHLDQHAGTSLIVINSVCGCAAGTARPGVRLALAKADKRPDKLATVFAGVDKDATAELRNRTAPFPPSSPSIALFKDGELVHFVERHHIEGRSAEMIGQHLEQVFDEYC